MFVGDTLTRILDLEANPMLVTTRPHRNLPPGRGEFERVGKEVSGNHFHFLDVEQGVGELGESPGGQDEPARSGVGLRCGN